MRINVNNDTNNTNKFKNDSVSLKTFENSSSIIPHKLITNIINKLGIFNKPDIENNTIHFDNDK